MPEPTTQTKTGRAMLVRTARAILWWDNLGKFAKASMAIGALVVGVVGVLLAASQAVEQGRRIWSGFAPLEGTMSSHLEAFEDHAAESQETHEHFISADSEQHALADSVLQLLGGLTAKADTLNDRQQWLECNRLQRRDELEGRPVRECSPFGGGS